MARQERLAYYKGMLDTSTQRKGGAANAKAGAGAGRASGLSQDGHSDSNTPGATLGYIMSNFSSTLT